MMFKVATFLLVLSNALSPASGQNCTLCHQGSTPNLTPGATVFDPAGQIDCATLDTLRATFNEGDPECADIQLGGFQGGCCPFPPFEKCSFCPDGADYNKDSSVPNGGASDPSCTEYIFSEAAYFPMGDVGDCDETALRRSAFYCCDGVEQECGLCPENDGNSFPAPARLSLRDNIIGKDSCRGIAFTSTLETSATCADSKAARGIDYAGFCGCPGVEPAASSCSVCGEGERLKSGDTVVFNEVGPDGKARDITCREADELAPFIINDGACLLLQNRTRAGCCSSASFLKVLSSAVIVGVALVATLM